MSRAFYLSDHLVPLSERPPRLLPGGLLSEKRKQDEGLMSEALGPSITPRHQEGTSCLHSFAFSLCFSPPKNNEISHKFPEVMQDTDLGRTCQCLCMCVCVCFRSHKREGHRASDAKDREEGKTYMLVWSNGLA